MVNERFGLWIDTRERVASLQRAMDKVLAEAAGIREKRWWTHEEFNNSMRCLNLTLQFVYIRHILNRVAERKNPLDVCTSFEWDEGNAHKNWERHRVTQEEAEDVFFSEPLIVGGDLRHSGREKRYYALGQSRTGRYLFVAFTIRHSLLRVISVRDMNQNESAAYDKHEKESDT